MTDGSSDRVLTHILEWTLWECGVRAELISQWADLRGLRTAPKGLAARIRKSIELYPCDLLFIHRDAEAASRQTRLEEIREAVQELGPRPSVAVIPVRMQESWLLCDESAIRNAAANPNGTVPLSMPRIREIEEIADPKEKVFSLLRTASERTGRKLQQFNVEFARSLICEQIADYSQLRALPSFAAFEADLLAVVQAHHLDTWL